MNGLGRFYRGHLRASPEGRVGSKRVLNLSCPGLKHLEAQDPSREERLLRHGQEAKGPCMCHHQEAEGGEGQVFI